ncbi:LptF/LptG family permease [Bacteriovoracaceae bacterium]|nr:LptF/LptG family permease [Bacteriovoracaceae bacterium]|tara:strand:+ start:78333 stop:79442 length:1110 start_codon:yes stop_codon:yes gene_type:complete
MSIIRTLITREWLKFFAGSIIVLFLLLTVANLISGFLRMNVTPLEVIINHILEIPSYSKLIIPVSCLIASLFSINKLKSRNELTAIFASGYSRKKFFYDLILVSVQVATVQLLIGFYLEPFAKAHKNILISDGEGKFRNLKGKGLRSSTIGSGKIWYKSDDYFFSFSTYDKAKDIIKDVTLYKFDEKSVLTEIISAREAAFDIKNDFWLVSSAKHTKDLNKQNFPIKATSATLKLPINEKPSDFKEIEADITTLNGVDLLNYIRKLNKSGINTNEYTVLFLEKLSSSLICIIFTLVAAISAFNPNRRSSSFGKNIGFVFVFTILYWLVNSYFVELGVNSKINPYVSTFGVPLVFLLFLITNFLNHRKLK